MAKSEEELELERRAKAATQQIDKAQLGEVLNRPQTFSTGPYTSKYPVGESATIVDRIQQLAGRSQPDNVPKFGEGPAGFAIRQAGYSNDLPKTKAMADNLRSQYPGASDTDLANMVTNAKPAPVPVPQATLEQQATNAANATEPKLQPAQTPKLYPGYEAPINEEANLSPEEQKSLNDAMAADQKGVLNLSGVENQLPNVTYRVPSLVGASNSGMDTAQQIASGALADRAMKPDPVDDVEVIKGSVITQGPRAASPAMVEQQLRKQMVERMIAKAQSGDRNALKTLVAVNGLRDVGTIPDTLKGMASARYDDVRATMEPGNSLAQRALQTASANNANENARKTGIESNFVEALAKNDMKYKDALATKALAENKKNTGIPGDVLKAAVQGSMTLSKDGMTLIPDEAKQNRLLEQWGYKAAKTAVPKPKTRAEAEAAYRKIYGDKYTDEQYKAALKRDGY